MRANQSGRGLVGQNRKLLRTRNNGCCSMDAAVAAVLSELDDISTFQEEQRTRLKAFLWSGLVKLCGASWLITCVKCQQEVLRCYQLDLLVMKMLLAHFSRDRHNLSRASPSYIFFELFPRSVCETFHVACEVSSRGSCLELNPGHCLEMLPLYQVSSSPRSSDVMCLIRRPRPPLSDLNTLLM